MHDPIANMISNIDAAIEDVKDMADTTKTVCIDEAEQLRREHEALRETVAQLRETVATLRQTYESQMLRSEPPRADISVTVSAGLSTTCLERLQDCLSQAARAVLILDKGHDSRPIVTCKIDVPAPKTSITFP